jgi:AcrR family transcriptional regulator
MATTPKRGRPRLTEEQRAEQRSKLLAGAMDAIRRHGPEVSVDDISREVGISKPVLYGHFGDKLGLADAIAVSMADAVTGAASRHVPGARPGDTGGSGRVDFTAAAEVIVTSLVDLVENEPEIYGFLVRTIRSGDRGFFDNALVEVIRERGGALVEAANPAIPPESRGVLVDGAFGFLLFSIESWAQRGAPGRAELERMLIEVVVNGFRTAAPGPVLVD